MPAAHIRVIACPNGGGFGGKSDIFNHEIVVCKAAMMTRPSGQDLPDPRRGLLLPPRPPPGADEDPHRRQEGRHAHRHAPADARSTAAATAPTASPALFYTGALQTVTYQLPRYRFEGCRVFTNKPPCGPKRGHGTPQPRFGQEIQLDKIAEQLDLDPAELRLRIVEKPNTITANWLRIGTIGLAECIAKVVEVSDWKDSYRKLPEGRGVGTRLRLVPLRRRAADLLEQDAALRRAAEARPQRRRHRVLRRDRDRPGLGRRARRAWSPRCWASSRSTFAASPATPT